MRDRMLVHTHPCHCVQGDASADTPPSPCSRLRTHSHQFSLRATKIQIEISDSIISRHLQPFKGIAVQYAAGASAVSGDSEPMLIVDSESYLLAT